jgi:hypothetical protein
MQSLDTDAGASKVRVADTEPFSKWWRDEGCRASKVRVADIEP